MSLNKAVLIIIHYIVDFIIGIQIMLILKTKIWLLKYRQFYLIFAEISCVHWPYLGQKQKDTLVNYDLGNNNEKS